MCCQIDDVILICTFFSLFACVFLSYSALSSLGHRLEGFDIDLFGFYQIVANISLEICVSTQQSTHQQFKLTQVSGYLHRGPHPLRRIISRKQRRGQRRLSVMFSILPSTLYVYLESSLLPSALTLLPTSHSTNFLFFIQITLYHSVSPISLSPLSQ